MFKIYEKGVSEKDEDGNYYFYLKKDKDNDIHLFVCDKNGIDLDQNMILTFAQNHKLFFSRSDVNPIFQIQCDWAKNIVVPTELEVDMYQFIKTREMTKILIEKMKEKECDHDHSEQPSKH